MSAINRCLFLDAQHNLRIEEREVPIPQKGEVLIKIAANGICGSDVHFYKDGRLGNFVVTEPYIPGHEASGTVEALGEGAKNFKEGDRVVIEPGIACGLCSFCKSGRYNLCPDVVFMSAPPVNGTFCDYITIQESFVFRIPDSLTLTEAALAEPAAVAVHCVNRARIPLGATGVIVGAGPIGLLVLQAFKAAGGGRAICVDPVESRLNAAKKLGADLTYPPGGPNLENIGDVVFETAGSKEATAALFGMARHGGKVIQAGFPDGNAVKLDIATLIEKELDYAGVHRYANAYGTAVTWLSDGRIKTDGLITHKFDFSHAAEAFKWAAENPGQTIKVVVEN
ncbi:MAG: alcohol dehydrogenase catalytic domain-containing protein [Oscillospiraceae bacterium]|nr:alcohol dehydrogenase catalytic domain-containing protein [Oscillospiraceae bacterium]